MHFKLRKTVTEQKFHPLLKRSSLVQTWTMFMQIPRLYESIAWGFRLAFCDMFRGTGLEIWYFDIICDVWIVADILVTLVTVVPKGSFPGQVRQQKKLLLELKN